MVRVALEDSTSQVSDGSAAEQTHIFDVGETISAQRVDRFVTDQLTSLGVDLSRARVQGLIKAGSILLDGRATKAKTLVESGMKVTVSIPPERSVVPLAEEIPLTILFEDSEIVVLNKAHGMVVHPAPGNPDGTLVNALLHHCGESLGSVGEPDRPGIVHRLDKDTSGCMVVAKTEKARESLVGQFSGRSTAKEYLAVVHGVPNPIQGRIENHIGRDPSNRQRMAVVGSDSGKEAITEYQVLDMPADPSTEGSAIVQCRILTGRTHQIRVHLRSLRCPILGDPIYANPKRQPVRVARLMLHARCLEIDHPVTGDRLKFEADVPDDFGRWMME